MGVRLPVALVPPSLRVRTLQPSWGLRRPGTRPLREEEQLAIEAPAPRELETADAGHTAPSLLHVHLCKNLGIGAAEAMALLQQGQVELNGLRRLTNCWLAHGDIVSVNGHRLEDITGLAFLAHKPAGCALTEVDALRRPTFVSLLPDPSLPVRALGRVDLKASGLLVL